MKKLLSALIAITICISSVQAQTDAAGSKPGNAPASTHRMPVASDYNTWSVGVHVGPTIFSGDLSDDAFNQDNFTTSLAYGLHVNKGISHTFGLQAHFLMGKLEGTHQMGSVKWSFESTLKYQAALRAVLTLGNVSFQRRQNKFHLYLAGGIGVMVFCF